MAFCTNCGKPVDQSSNFCRYCGTPVGALAEQINTSVAEQTYAAPVEQPYAAPAEQTYAAPVEQPYAVPAEPVYVQPVAPVYAVPAEQTYAAPAAPAVSVKTKVLGFVGMGLGIGGLVFAVIGILYTLIGMMETGVAFGMAIAFGGFFSLPCSIVGILLCKQSQDAGNLSTPCTVGAKLSLAAIIVSGVMLFLGFVNLFA